jgi:acyl-ACP thioesterase
LLRDGNVVAEMVTVWAFVDVAARKLLKVSDYTGGIPTYEPLIIDLPAQIKITRDTQFTLVGERNIVYSDLNVNGHMNNAKYPDMLCDFIPALTGRRVAAVSINYNSELFFGDTVKVYTSSGDESEMYFVKLVRENGVVCTEAKIIFDGM